MRRSSLAAAVVVLLLVVSAGGAGMISLASTQSTSGGNGLGNDGFGNDGAGNAPPGSESGASATDNGSAELPVTDGLVLELTTARGVVTDGNTGTVTRWTDQSGQGNDLSAIGDPQLLTNATPSGSAAVSFDGDGDALGRNDARALPTGDADRTVVLLVRYDSAGPGGVVYGVPEANRAFGAVVDRHGRLAARGWGDANDFASGADGTGTGWLIQTVTVDGSEFTHYRNGVHVDSGTHRFDTANGSLVLGANLNATRFLDAEVAAVLVYDRALSDAERRRVERHLDETDPGDAGTGGIGGRGPGSGPNTAPTARDDAATVPRGESVRIDVLANDIDPDGALNASSITVTGGPTNGSTTVIPSTGAITYTNDGSTATNDSFTYTVEGDDGTVSSVATVSIDVASGNLPPTARDDSVTTYPGTVAVVRLLANDTDPDGRLDRSSIKIRERPDNGTLKVLGNSGLVRYRHGRLAGYRDSFAYAVRDDDGNVSNVATVSVNITKKANWRGRGDPVGGGSPPGDPAGRSGSTTTSSTDTSTGGLTTQAITSSNESDFSTVRILSGYNQPVAFEFLPDGRMIFLQKNGQMHIANATESPVAAEKYMTVPNVRTKGEQGLLDIALDPNFTDNGYFYVYYTNDTVDKNRISRFEHVENGGGLDSYGRPESEKLVWQNEQTNVSICCHFGGGLDIGPDGMLWLTTGDQFNGSTAQDLTVAHGKIIRVNRNGTIPSTNPFTDDPDALDAIYAYGLRNPYRANFDLPTDRFFIGEVGGNNDSVAYEDIHVDVKGANYGWPDCEGFCENPDYTDPIYAYPHNGSGASVTVGPIYRGDQFPTTYDGKLFYGDYVRGWIKYLSFNSSGGVTNSSDFYSSDAAIVFIGQGPDGSLYYVDIIDGEIHRISYTGNQPPEITEATANTTEGLPPLTVEFTGNATDADGDDLSYTWRFGDGNESSGRTAVHTYHSNGSYDAYLDVSDGNTTVTSDPITIQVGSPPNVTVRAPPNETLFRAGETIVFEANGSDSDGELNDSQYSWDLVFLHDEHTHPGFDDVNGSTATYAIPTDGHDYSGDTGYRATVTVTDADGLTDTDSVVILPEKVNLTFRTDPSGLEFKLDSIERSAPYRHDTLINFTHTIEAPETQCLDGTEYSFANWSDGGARVHDITVPETGTEYTARYEADRACDRLITDGLVLQLESGTGLTTSGGTVTEWADQSGQGNDLAADGDPQLLPDATPAGAAAVSFDGDGDALLRTASLAGFPTGNQNRTVFVVTDYQSPGHGGFAYGTDDCNQAFGLIVDDAGALTVQGWCPANDYSAGVEGPDAGWLSQAAVLTGSQLVHYRNGTRIDSVAHSYDTRSDRLVLGAELTPAPYLDMEVAAVLVYDRALSDAERQQVEQYLNETYLGAG